ncbi:Calx-beta domain-containing protein [Chitinophaga japonensis]|uniref:Gliding motility-associated-like protein n=1 Tax=Chitinophaga japonensis TaxID=104662 RepID=A0A562T4U5_CHIJA|nr:Calx-beta domain-containing protein [Chitinophaga japonensis]TWI88555.1 gliding motility-associated-like protein [Chitinophaga japonensis]
MSVFPCTLPGKVHSGFCKALARLQKHTALLVLLLLLAGGSVRAQVIETINNTGGTAGDPGLKMEILADGTFRVFKNGLSQTYEGTDDPRGIAAYVGQNTLFYDDMPRQVKRVAWSFVSPLAGTGTAADPWRIQMVGNVQNFISTADITVICDLTYVKDQPYFILDYTVAVLANGFETYGHLYVAEHAVLDVSGSDWSANSVCTQGYGPYPGPFGTVGVYRDAACGGYPVNRAHMFRMQNGFSSYLATDAAGMASTSIPENGFLANISNSSFDGTENGVIVHKYLGPVYGGNTSNVKVFTARILSGYGNTISDLDGVTGLDSIAPPANRQLRVEFDNATAAGQEGDDRHAATNLNLRVKGTSSTVTLTRPLYVGINVTPSGTYPAVAGADYEAKRGIVIPPGSYSTGGRLISLDTSIMILGNTVLENSPRTFTINLDNSYNNNLVTVNTSKNICEYQIQDDEDRTLTITAPVEIDEGQTANATISLPAGVLASQDITVTLARNNSSTAAASDIVLPASVVIRQNTNSATFTIQAENDKILEYTETLNIQADATVLGSAQTAGAAVNIRDRTYDDPANRVITMRPVPGITVAEPYTGGLQFSLPAGVTTDMPLHFTLGALHNDPSSTASATDYTLDSTAFRISTGNSVTIPFTVVDDNLVEGTEALYVTATVVDAESRTYDFTPYNIQILDDDASALTVTASATEIVEGGATITLTISLPSGTFASSDIPLTVTGGGSSSAADYTPLPDATFMIPAGANNATFSLMALADDMVEGDETLVISGSATDYTITPFTLTIRDVTWNDPSNLQLEMSVTGSPVKEGNTAGLRVRFVNDVKAGKPIVVTLTRAASSVAGTSDYALASGTITIPAGQREITVADFITAQTDMVLENAESFTLNGASSDLPGLTVSSATGTIDDATGDDPANKVITIATQPAPMNEGSGYNVTFSLPAGVTTEVPINIMVKTGSGSTATGADYSMATVPPLDNNNASVSGTITITADGVLETDETLMLDGESASLPGITFVPASITLKDQDYVAGLPLEVTANNTVITEGSTTGALVTVSLSGNKITSYDIPVTITKGSSSTAGDAEHNALPVTVTIAAGTGAVTFPQALLATADNLLEDDETLVVRAASTGFTEDSLALTVRDGSNRKVTLQPQPFSAGYTMQEGNSYTVRIALPAGITPYKPLQVTVSAGAATQAATTDYTGLPAIITIYPGENFKDITLAAVTDNIVELTELLRLKGTVSGFAGVTADSMDVQIQDVTGQDPANRQLMVTIDSTTLHEGSDARVTIGFVKTTITSSQHITVNITPDAAFTGAAADYSGLPAQVQLPAGSNRVQLTLHMVDDNLAEGTEQLKLNTTVTTGYTVLPPATVTIPEATLQISATKTADAAEPDTNGSFTIQLPGTLLAGADINVTSLIGGTAGAADWSVTGANVVIRAGAHSVTVPVNVLDDKLMEGDETVTLTLQQARMPRGSSVVNFTVDAAMHTVVLRDDENDAPGRSMMVEKVTDAAEPSTAGAFRIRFSDPQLTVLKDVEVTYAVTGTAIAGTDYTPLPGTLTIPAGQNGVTVNLAPVDDILVEDTELVNIRIQSVSSTMTGITWPLADNPQADVPLVDNDTMFLNIFATPASVTEGDTIQVTIQSPVVSSVDIPVYLKVVHDPVRTVATSEGTINGNGDTLVVTLPAGVTEHTFTVVTDNNDMNDDEGFVFLQVLPDASGAPRPLYRPGLASEINAVVSDNDPLELSFSAAVYRVNEGNQPEENSLTFEVRLSRMSSRTITLPYRFVRPAGVTAIGAAIPGVDYDSIMKPVEIQPGELGSYIPVPIMGDSTFERDDTLGIVLLPPTVLSGQNVPTTAAPDSVLGIIMNDDPFCAECDTDGDGIPDGKEDVNGNEDPLDDDSDGDGIPNYLDDDSDNDGVPDRIEGWITDDRWVNDNEGKIRVHPAISPNEDGMGNDAMYIENIEKYPRNEVVIFNRWGGTVFKMSGYNNQDKNFRGLNNSGKEVTDGSYFYLIEIQDETGKKEQYTGFIVIKRK